MKITRKTVRVDDARSETRYFADTGDGFDGTAHGYGFRSIERLYRAHWFFKNRARLEALRSEARRFLQENPPIAAILQSYFSPEHFIVAWKDHETLSIASLIEDLEQVTGEDELVSKLKAHRHLWRTLESGTADK